MPPPVTSHLSGEPESMFDLLCAGGTHQDLVARAAGPIRWDDSNRACIRHSWGGVALNVARKVAEQDLRSAIMVPNLAIFDEIEQIAGQTGLRDHLVPISLGMLDLQPVTYVAVEHPDGSLLTGVIDDAAYDAVDAEVLLDQYRKTDSRMWFMDANYPAEALEMIASIQDRPPLAIDCVSTIKAPKATGCIGKCDYIFGNSLEIDCVRDHPEIGSTTVVETNGTKPVKVHQNGTVTEVPVVTPATGSVTGAGDALIGGTLSAVLKGLSIEDAVKAGIKTAGAHISSQNKSPDDRP